MEKKGSTVGIILIIIGIMVLVDKIFNLNILNMSNFWPLFVLIPGLCFEFGYFVTGRNPGVLVPGGILTVIGLLFFFETFTGWQYAGDTWPIYPLAVAIGLFQLYLFGYREKALLIPVFILGAVSVISFVFIIMGGIFMWVNGSVIAAVLFILGGLTILFGNFKNKKTD